MVENEQLQDKEISSIDQNPWSWMKNAIWIWYVGI